MKRAFLADAQPDERSALRLVLQDLNMQVVGEAADWPTVSPTAAKELVLCESGTFIATLY